LGAVTAGIGTGAGSDVGGRAITGAESVPTAGRAVNAGGAGARTGVTAGSGVVVGATDGGTDAGADGGSAVGVSDPFPDTSQIVTATRSEAIPMANITRDAIGTRGVAGRAS
jgi:hypothetical protein